jgi:hypothetical protein
VGKRKEGSVNFSGRDYIRSRDQEFLSSGPTVGQCYIDGWSPTTVGSSGGLGGFIASTFSGRSTGAIARLVSSGSATREAMLLD